MRELLKLFFLSVLCIGQLAAQGSWCGTVGEDARAIAIRLADNQLALKNKQLVYPRSTVFVPIKFHLIGKDDGTRRIPMSDVYDQLCELNSHFSDQDIQFYIKEGLDLIDNSLLYENHMAYQNIMAHHADQKAINVFLMETVNALEETIVGYYNKSFDWIVLRNADVGRNRALTHEIGHFFSLLHPFHGWDLEPYDPKIHGTPAPDYSPMGIPTEKMDHSNCATAGDRLCDTPADYNFFGWPNCEYDGGALDPSGTLVNPEEKLFMNYFNCNREEYYFSEEQKAIMMADLLSTKRFRIRGGSPKSTSTIPTRPTLLFPTSGQESESGNSADLFWTEVSGATQYLIEVDVVPNFTSEELRSRFSSRNSITIDELEPGTNYFWRVKPINDYYTCQKFTNFTNFKTAIVSGTQSLPGVTGVSLSPNPLRDQRLRLHISAAQSMEVFADLIDVTGRTVHRFGKLDLSAGLNELPLSVQEGLPDGLYHFRMRSGRGIRTERILLLR